MLRTPYLPHFIRHGRADHSALFKKSRLFRADTGTFKENRPRHPLVNGVWAHMNETLHTGDLLCLHLEENTSGTSIFPQQIPLEICYEDEDLLVIDKPAGMPVHPSAAHQRDTLANAVTGYYRAKAKSACSAASTGWMPTRAARSSSPKYAFRRPCSAKPCSSV